MIRILKYLRGYLRIRVRGFSPERFMNLCSNRGILLWDIVREDDGYCMYISLKGFWELRPIVKKTGTRVAVLERYGLPFFLPGLMKRKVFVLGMALAVIFWLWSSGYVWSINLYGNYRITDDMFMSFLEQNGVTVGMNRKNLNIGELEKRIRRNFPLVTWVSAKLDGTKLIIDLKENDVPPVEDDEKETAGTDLVADYSGVVVSMIVRSGVPKVSIGDTVEAGALLVEGKIPICNDDATVREYRYVDADADIVLEYGISHTESLPLDYVKKVYTGREKQSRYLRFGSSRLSLPRSKPYLVYDSLIRESTPIVFKKLSVPVAMGICTYREYQNVEYKYTDEEAEAELTKKLNDFLASLEEKGVQIIEKNVTISMYDDRWVLEGGFMVRGPVKKRIPTEKVVIGESEEDDRQ